MLPKTDSSGNSEVWNFWRLTFKISRIQPLHTFTAPPWSKPSSVLPASLQLLLLLKSIPTTAARLTHVEHKTDHISPLLKTLQWFLIPLCIKAKVLVMATRANIIWSPLLLWAHLLPLCLVHSTLATLASLLFFKYARTLLSQGLYTVYSTDPDHFFPPDIHIDGYLTFFTFSLKNHLSSEAYPYQNWNCNHPALSWHFLHSTIFYKPYTLLIYCVYHLSPSTKI